MSCDNNIVIFSLFMQRIWKFKANIKSALSSSLSLNHLTLIRAIIYQIEKKI